MEKETTPLIARGEALDPDRLLDFAAALNETATILQRHGKRHDAGHVARVLLSTARAVHGASQALRVLAHELTYDDTRNRRG